jgi:hypothetical protein
MAWYDDAAKTEFVGSYANEKQLKMDTEAAQKRGWVVREVQPSYGDEEGGAAGGRVVGGSAFPGTASRTKERFAVTFVRDPDWLVRRQEEIANAIQGNAARAADEKEAKLVRADAELREAEDQFSAKLDAATGAAADREPAERDVLRTLRTVIARRQAVLKAADEALSAMGSAVAVGAVEFARSIAKHQDSRAVHMSRLESELHLLEVQEDLAHAAKEWRTASDRKLAVEEELRRRTAEFDAEDRLLTALLADRTRALSSLPVLVR